MAKYEVKMSCGHTETVNLFGAMKDRDRKIAWLGEHGICTACYKAHRDAAHATATAEAAAKATEENLPALTGSEKQINWALTIRANKLADLAKMVEAGNAKIADQAQRDKNQMACQAARNVLVAKTEAKFWIDNRDVDAKRLIAANNLQDELKAEFAKLTAAASDDDDNNDDDNNNGGNNDNNNEPDTDDYAVNPDALEVAVNAEIQAANAEAREVEEKSQEELKMKTIETKIAKNGAKMYYVDGKRVSRKVAEEIENKQTLDRRNNLVENTFARYEKESGAVVVTAGYKANIVICFDGYLDFTYTRNYSTCEDAINAVNFFKTNFCHGSDGKFETGNVTREVEAECNGIAYSRVLHYYMIDAADSEGQFLKDFESPTEASPDDYAVNQEAMDVAVDAEIEAMKVAREERIKAAQKEVADYIAKIDEQEKQEKVAAFERELAEYYSERELANKEHTPEYKYYIKSRRPIAGAVPKGYISATAGEMKAYSFCTDGSISRVPRKVVFGVVVYDHPLSDEQIINYDLHVDPRNPNLNPETQENTAGEPDEPKFETGKTYYIKDGDSYYTLKVDARTDKMLTGTTPHGTCKYHIHDTFRGEYIRTHLYDDCGNREMIWAANEYINKEETQTTKQAEFYADKIRRESKSYGECDVFLPPDSDIEEEDDELIDPPVDSTLTVDIAKYQAAFDTARQISIRAGSGVCKINGEEIWFNYGNLRSIDSNHYRAEITFNNGRKRFRYRGMITKRADFLDRMSNEIVAAEQKEIFGKFYDTYQMPDTTLDPNADYFQIRIFPKFANGTESSFHATANDFPRALELIELFKSLNLPFIGLIKRNTVCGEEYYRHNRDGSEVINPPEIDNTPADKEPYHPFTPKEEVDIINHNINWAKGILATMQGDTYTDDIGETFTRNQLKQFIADWQDEIADMQTPADKPAEPPKPVELVAPTVMSALETINAMFPLDGFVEDVSKPNFKSAVNGDWRLNIFIDKNGTPEAVSLAEDDQLFLTVKIKARSLRDSINRAIKTCVKNRIAYRKKHNAEMEKYEYELMHLLQAARRELEVA